MASEAESSTVMGGDKQAKDGAKITLYWLEKSRSHRILWLLEELSLPYTLKIYKRQNMLAPPALQKIHPLGKSPILTVESDATTAPIVLAESGAIIEYLIEHFGPEKLAPSRWREGCEGKVGGETEGWLRWRYYMHYGEGTLMPYLVLAIILETVKSSTPFPLRPLPGLLSSAIHSKYLTPNLTTNYAFLESQLASSPNNGKYLCGDKLTGADILLSFPLKSARDAGVGGFTREKFPGLWEYVGRIDAEAGNRRAVEKVGEEGVKGHL